MNRPCECGKCFTGQPFVRGRDCARCWLWENGRWPVSGATTGQTLTISLPVLCSRLGVNRSRVAGSNRNWRRCNGGYGSTAKGAENLVCECGKEGKGVWRVGYECGPTCPGYSAPAIVGASPNPYPYFLVPPNPYPIPGPPITIGRAPDLTPRSDRLVCTVAVGEKGSAMLAATGPLMERYAAKVGADFQAITGPALNHAYPLADKFRLHHLTPRYKRLLFIDADAIVHPDAPDLFAEVPTGVGVRDDAGEATNLNYLSDAYRRTVASQGESHTDGGRVLNSGVVLWGRDTPDVWKPPAKPIPADTHVAEQCWVQRNITANGYPLTLLERRWNHQWWTDRQFADVLAGKPWILHMAGMSQSAQVSGWSLSPDTVRSALLIVGAWMAGK